LEIKKNTILLKIIISVISILYISMVSVNQFLKLNNNKNNYIAIRNTLRSISRNSYDKNMTKRI